MAFRPPPFLRFSPYHGFNYQLLRWRRQLLGQAPSRIDSIVIPCYGEDYVEEASLAARFAHMNMTDAREIILATNLPVTAFGKLPDTISIKTLDLPSGSLTQFNNIYNSRLLKIQAPLHCTGPVILMVDSDLMLLKNLQVQLDKNLLLGSFRMGKMSFKLKGISHQVPEIQGTFRPYLKSHINGGFLLAQKELWQRLCPLWLELYQDIWQRLNTSRQPPTDQLPLAIALDKLKINAGNLGDWANWPVSKKIGGTTQPIPLDVIGAHGGFPISEYEKLLQNRDAPLTFHDQYHTRKVRYQ